MHHPSRTRMLVLTGLSIALIASGAFVSIPFGPVPFTLQTMMLGIVVCLLPPRYAIGAVAGYLVLGAFGLPVFSGMRGGIGMFAGPTGGFLVGYLVAAGVVALVRSRVLSVAAGGGVAKGAEAGAAAGTGAERTGATERAEQAGHVARAKRRLAWLYPVLDVASLVLFSVVMYIPGCFWFAYGTSVSLEAALAAAFVPFVITDTIKAAAAFVCIQAIRRALGLAKI